MFEDCNFRAQSVFDASLVRLFDRSFNITIDVLIGNYQRETDSAN